jgi:hypothetical protein
MGEAFKDEYTTDEAIKKGVLLGRDSASVGIDKRGKVLHGHERPSHKHLGDRCAHDFGGEWQRNEVLGVALDFQAGRPSPILGGTASGRKCSSMRRARDSFLL